MLLPRQHSIKIAHPNNNNTFAHDTMAPSVCDEESHQLDTTFHSSDGRQCVVVYFYLLLFVNFKVDLTNIDGNNV